MSAENIIEMGREAIVLMLTLSAPALLTALAVGVFVGVLQALTQIQEQTIAFVPKIIAVVLAVSLVLPWILNRLVQYSHDLITNIPIRL